MKKLIPVILRIFPRPFLIRLSYIFMRFSAYFLKGDNVECPVCKGKFKKFLPYGHVDVRKNALCPKCLSLERHRLLWLFLKEKTDFFLSPKKVLHIAPEQCFYEKFRKQSNLEYITADLESPLADIKLDIQSMPIDDNSFDVVICNHVLEHVPDDTKALKEILRILKTGGFAILISPVDFNRSFTFEDDSITDPRQREKLFYQKDHFRIYGTDYPERLIKAGFKIKNPEYFKELNPEIKKRYSLAEKEYLFLCIKESSY